MDLSTVLSFIGSLYKFIINVPFFGAGILVGAFGYRLLLKKNPAMLQKLVNLVQTEASNLASKATPSTTSAPTDQSSTSSK